jgi:hypothetical protein
MLSLCGKLSGLSNDFLPDVFGALATHAGDSLYGSTTA